MTKATSQSVLLATGPLDILPDAYIPFDDPKSLDALYTTAFADECKSEWEQWALENEVRLIERSDLELSTKSSIWPEYPTLRESYLLLELLKKEPVNRVILLDFPEIGFCFSQEKQTHGPLSHLLLVSLFSSSVSINKYTVQESLPAHEHDIAAFFMGRYSIQASDGIYANEAHVHDLAFNDLTVKTLPQSIESLFDVPKLEVGSADSVKPLVSVCLTHYNYADLLPRQLDSLAKQSYENLEVIVLDDGSSNAKAVESFLSMQSQYESRGWKFIRQENGYVGQARNNAAQLAQGDFIIFVDPDNVSKPNMVERFVQAMLLGEFDALTCWHAVFSKDESLANGDYDYIYTPLGPCLETGWIKNTFGDANFCVRKATFDSIGGFTEDRNLGCEDWEFLAKLVIKDHNLGVIPEPLYSYRRDVNSMFSTMDVNRSHARALRPYIEASPSVLKSILLGAVDTQRSLQESNHLLQHQQANSLGKSSPFGRFLFSNKQKSNK